MGKKVKRARYHLRNREAAVLGSDDDQFSDPNEEEMLKDEIDEFHLQQEKILLNQSSPWEKNQHEEEEEEVLPLDSSVSDESDDQEFATDGVDMTSDIEDKDHDDLPDPKAWGKKRSMYYATDYVDEDFGGFDGADAEAAEMEEKEARVLQQKFMEQLTEADFDLGLFAQPQKPSEEKTELEEKVKKDFSDLSKKERLELIKTESPELIELIKEFKEQLGEVKNKWLILKQLVDEKKIPHGPAAEYVTIKCHIILNYCVNINHFMMLKALRQVDQSHPVIRRLKSYYNLLKKTSTLDAVLQPQIDAIMDQLEEKGTYEPIIVAKKPQKKVKFMSNEKMDEEKSLFVDNMEMQESLIEEVEFSDKRGINYQIAKNKGLTPHRKKEQRNPRVKHRMKYKKAKMRRRGQVRESRKELSRYGGEISGIKANLKKSIKLH